MFALTALDGEYWLTDTTTRKRGVYNEKGELLRYEGVDLSQDEITFKIWAQKQLPSIKEKKLREMWNKLNATK